MALRRPGCLFDSGQGYMKREFSAGGVVYKKIGGNPCPLWLVVQHSQHKGWVFPKGLIGDIKNGESKEETALREVEEEGGIKAKIIAEIPKAVEYWYQFEGEKIFKKVYFYLMEYLSGSEKDHDSEVSSAEWLTVGEVEKRLTYDNDKRVFAEAVEILEGSHSGRVRTLGERL